MSSPSTTTPTTTHTPAGGLDQLVRIAQAQPLAPACDHFYFLRHGQTGRNALRIFQAPDEPLSELGLQQAARAAELLAGEPIRTIVCSDARRALDTAHAVGAALRLVPTAHETLRERNFGALIGTSSAHIDWACEPEGGETLAQFVARKRAALDAALRQSAPVLVVAHGGTLYVLAALLGVPVDAAIMGNAQPLRFERTGPTWAVTPLLRHSDTDGAAALA
uniref:histidine phosphatase family protein n=1 Tax=unclassified Variovorax TaxID=663243 RepID=UPI000D3A8142